MGFNRWCRCFSKTGYLYEFDLYLGKDEKRELRIGETVVLDLSKKLENTHFMLFFITTLVEKLFDSGIYCPGTV